MRFKKLTENKEIKNQKDLVKQMDLSVKDAEEAAKEEHDKNVKVFKDTLDSLKEGFNYTINVKNRANLAKLVESLKEKNIKHRITRSKTEGFKYDVMFKYNLKEAKELERIVRYYNTEEANSWLDIKFKGSNYFVIGGNPRINIIDDHEFSLYNNGKVIYQIKYFGATEPGHISNKNYIEVYSLDAKGNAQKGFPFVFESKQKGNNTPITDEDQKKEWEAEDENNWNESCKNKKLKEMFEPISSFKEYTYIDKTNQGWEIKKAFRDKDDDRLHVVVYRPKRNDYAVGLGYSPDGGYWNQGWYDYINIEDAISDLKNEYNVEPFNLKLAKLKKNESLDKNNLKQEIKDACKKAFKEVFKFEDEDAEDFSKDTDVEVQDYKDMSNQPCIRVVLSNGYLRRRSLEKLCKYIEDNVLSKYDKNSYFEGEDPTSYSAIIRFNRKTLKESNTNITIDIITAEMNQKEKDSYFGSVKQYNIKSTPKGKSIITISGSKEDVYNWLIDCGLKDKDYFKDEKAYNNFTKWRKNKSLKESAEDKTIVKVYRLITKDGDYQGYGESQRYFYNAGDLMVQYDSTNDWDFPEGYGDTVEDAINYFKKEYKWGPYGIKVNNEWIQPIPYRAFGFDENGNKLEECGKSTFKGYYESCSRGKREKLLTEDPTQDRLDELKQISRQRQLTDDEVKELASLSKRKNESLKEVYSAPTFVITTDTGRVIEITAKDELEARKIFNKQFSLENTAYDNFKVRNHITDIKLKESNEDYDKDWDLDEFDDDEVCIYQFPQCDIDWLKDAHKYNVKILGQVSKDGFQPGDYVIKGTKKDLLALCDDCLHPDYLYHEGDFNTDLIETLAEKKKQPKARWNANPEASAEFISKGTSFNQNLAGQPCCEDYDDRFKYNPDKETIEWENDKYFITVDNDVDNPEYTIFRKADNKFIVSRDTLEDCIRIIKNKWIRESEEDEDSYCEKRIKQLKQIKKQRPLTDQEEDELNACIGNIDSEDAERKFLNKESLKEAKVSLIKTDKYGKYGTEVKIYQCEGDEITPKGFTATVKGKTLNGTTLNELEKKIINAVNSEDKKADNTILNDSLKESDEEDEVIKDESEEIEIDDLDDINIDEFDDIDLDNISLDDIVDEDEQALEVIKDKLDMHGELAKGGKKELITVAEKGKLDDKKAPKITFEADEEETEILAKQFCDDCQEDEEEVQASSDSDDDNIDFDEIVDAEKVDAKKAVSDLKGMSVDGNKEEKDIPTEDEVVDIEEEDDDTSLLDKLA